MKKKQNGGKRTNANKRFDKTLLYYNINMYDEVPRATPMSAVIRTCSRELLG